MSDRVRLFISAGVDLESEREAIGRALTEFPVNLGWEIKRTPRPGQPVDLDGVRDADVFILLFGSDIQAPVGSEWMTAHRGVRLRLAFLKRTAMQTPAGREFSRQLRDEWRLFRNAGELVQQIQQALSAHILERWREFGLNAQEWGVLTDYLGRLRGEKSDRQGERGTAETTGAGEGGVILAPERVASRGGVIVDG